MIEARCACGCGLLVRNHQRLVERASDKRVPLDLWWNTLDATYHDQGDEDPER